LSQKGSRVWSLGGCFRDSGVTAKWRRAANDETKQPIENKTGDAREVLIDRGRRARAVCLRSGAVVI
jgi:hypothetical protein